jgi:hypothetical protein
MGHCSIGSLIVASVGFHGMDVATVWVAPHTTCLSLSLSLRFPANPIAQLLLPAIGSILKEERATINRTMDQPCRSVSYHYRCSTSTQTWDANLAWCSNFNNRVIPIVILDKRYCECDHHSQTKWLRPLPAPDVMVQPYSRYGVLVWRLAVLRQCRQRSLEVQARWKRRRTVGTGQHADASLWV